MTWNEIFENLIDEQMEEMKELDREWARKVLKIAKQR